MMIHEMSDGFLKVSEAVLIHQRKPLQDRDGIKAEEDYGCGNDNRDYDPC